MIPGGSQRSSEEGLCNLPLILGLSLKEQLTSSQRMTILSRPPVTYLELSGDHAKHLTRAV